VRAVIYTIQVSNHVGAGARLPTAAASKSWITVYDGPCASVNEARATVDRLTQWYRHARVFRGNKRTGGKLWYANLRMGVCVP